MRVQTVLAAAVAAAASFGSVTALASSHREAPFITEQPKVDGTDFYMFRSYETGRDAFVTIIANYLPLQDAYGGPNYFSLDPNALYEIHIDNNGDAAEDLTFQFRFTDNYKNLAIDTGAPNLVTVPLKNIGGIGPGAGDTANLNVEETFTLTVVRGDRRSGTAQPVTNMTTGGTTFRKPVDNIGNKSISDYATYANNHIWPIGIPGCAAGGKVFVGQRAEGFVVNLGEVFDLVNLNPLGARDSRSNTIGDKNVTSLALEIPTTCLTNGTEPVIGGWTTASLRQARILNPSPQGPTTMLPSVKGAAVEGGAWTQVSRLGSPLVNEVVIGLDQKDKFNASEPKDDLNNFATFVTNPTLPVLVDILFFGGNGDSTPATPRSDLVAAFVTGITANVNGMDFNYTKPAGNGAGEMLRLNTVVGITAAASQSDLGFLACDLGGFPNGRRPIDDVVDIELTVAEGAITSANKNSLQTCDTSGPTPTVVNAGAVVNDGAAPSASDYLTVFPYLNTPLPGSPAMASATQ